MDRKEILKIMVNDWISDQGESAENLEIKEFYYDENLEDWAAYAEDENNRYILSDSGNGDIRIDYAG